MLQIFSLCVIVFEQKHIFQQFSFVFLQDSNCFLQSPQSSLNSLSDEAPRNFSSEHLACKVGPSRIRGLWHARSRIRARSLSSSPHGLCFQRVLGMQDPPWPGHHRRRTPCVSSESLACKVRNPLLGRRRRRRAACVSIEHLACKVQHLWPGRRLRAACVSSEYLVGMQNLESVARSSSSWLWCPSSTWLARQRKVRNP